MRTSEQKYCLMRTKFALRYFNIFRVILIKFLKKHQGGKIAPFFQKNNIKILQFLYPKSIVIILNGCTYFF